MSNFINKIKEQLIFSGTSLNPGIAAGKAFVLKNLDIHFLINNKHPIDVIDREFSKLDFAVQITKDQIALSLENTKKNNLDLMNTIFNAYLCISEDANLIYTIKETIKNKSFNCESVLAEEIIKLRHSILKCTDDFKLKLMNTLQDLYYRILYNLIPSSEDRIELIRKTEVNSILISDRLTPIEVGVIPIDKVNGVVLEEASKNSHASLMLQSLKIPVIINVPGIGSSVNEKDELILDSNESCIILNPDAFTIKKYKRPDKQIMTDSQSNKIQIIKPELKTTDDFKINILCNASNLSDIQSAQMMGITDIGLFRSEMFYLSNSTLPDDEKEKTFYKELFDVKSINTLSIRLYDIGGDKLPIFMQLAKESNPELGCRGIRFLLSHQDIMKKQIRNILASCQTEKLRFILPFITTIDDIENAKDIIRSVFDEMKVPMAHIKIGIMVEIPSAAFSIEKILPKVDFINLGTNDLIQYFFAVNRDQSALKKYNKFTHPAFIKLLKNIITECNNQNKQIICCGEMSSHPLGCVILAALGIKYLSIQPEAIQQIYQTLIKSSLTQIQQIIPEIIDFEKAEEVEQKLHSLGFI